MAEEHWKCHLRTALDLQASDQVNHFPKHLQSLLRFCNFLVGVFLCSSIHLIALFLCCFSQAFEKLVAKNIDFGGVLVNVKASVVCVLKEASCLALYFCCQLIEIRVIGATSF